MSGVFDATGSYEDFCVGLYMTMPVQDPQLAC